MPRTTPSWIAPLCFAVCLLCAPASQAQPVELKVFGLPLGGKPAPEIDICPADETTSDVACWIGAAQIAEDTSLFGRLFMPDGGKLPLWARNGEFAVVRGIEISQAIE
jgi:hypothetical protein